MAAAGLAHRRIPLALAVCGAVTGIAVLDLQIALEQYVGTVLPAIVGAGLVVGAAIAAWFVALRR